MTARKSERLLNLLITLLVSRTYVSKDRLREVVEPYREAGDDAFEKMFERDKEELRSLGIPIEVGYVDRAFEDEPGYRVERSAFELPEIDLAPEEAAVIGLAARVWQHAGARRRDLRRAGQAQGRRRHRRPGRARRRAADAERRGAVVRAASGTPPAPARRCAFGYRTLVGASAPATRHLQPWGVVSYRGRWYVTGHDTDRGEPAGLPALPGAGRRHGRRQAGLLRGPARHRPARHRPSRSPRGRPTAPPRCWSGAGAAHGLRRHAQPLDGRAGPETAGTGSRRRTARPTRSPTRCSATAPTSSSLAPAGRPRPTSYAGCGRPPGRSVA